MYLGDAWDAVFVDPRWLDLVRGHPELNQDLYEFDQLVSSFVVMDTTQPPFDNPKVRRAFAMAVDREKLIEEMLEGGVKLANGLLPPGIPGYHIPFDPEMARQLLAESRYADELPKIIFTVSDDEGRPSLTVQFMLDSWEENLGVEVKVELVDPDEYFYNLGSTRKHLYPYG